MATRAGTPSQSRRVALVTGGARRLGRHIALGLADQGCDVVITYRNSAADARRTVGELKSRGSNARAVRAELTAAGDVRKIFRAIEHHYGRLDIAIGNAGLYPDAIPLEELSEKIFDGVIDTNLKANFLVGKSAATLMHKYGRGGKIVFMASLGGLQIWRDRLAYNVSKSALITMTRAMARAVAAQSITVNAIAPGHIELADEPGAVPTFGPSRVPMQRFGTPSDIVDAVLFFTESASYVTGQVLAVDGGMSTIG